MSVPIRAKGAVCCPLSAVCGLVSAQRMPSAGLRDDGRQMGDGRRQAAAGDQSWRRGWAQWVPAKPAGPLLWGFLVQFFKSQRFHHSTLV